MKRSRFSEEQWPDLGFYYLRARYLDPNLGRFHTLDTYEGRNGEPATLHKYLYTHANPVNLIDPSGNLVPNQLLGIMVHNKIGADFVAGSPATRNSNNQIRTIVREVKGTGPSGSGGVRPKGSIYIRLPDLVDRYSRSLRNKTCSLNTIWSSATSSVYRGTKFIRRTRMAPGNKLQTTC